MRIIKVVIADKNQVYTKALTEFLLSEYGQAFDISCFSGAKSLAEHLRNKQDIDILLIDQALYNDTFKGFNIKKLLILTENSYESEIDGITALFKYQLGDQIAKEMLKSYDASVGSRFHVHSQQRQGKLIAVYSPAGGSGKSTIAYNVARQYSIQGRKTILISMESYSSNYFLKTDSNNRGLSYLMHLIKSKANNLQVKFDAIKEVDVNTNVHFIPRNCNSLEYKDIESEDIATLLEFLKKHSGYEAIILDMDSAISGKLLYTFKHCDVILNIRGNDLVNMDKHQSFSRQIEMFGNQLKVNLVEKIISVNNKVLGQSNDKHESDANLNEVNIPYINDNLLAENGLYPELSYFKRLYDVIEEFFTGKRVSA